MERGTSVPVPACTARGTSVHSVLRNVVVKHTVLNMGSSRMVYVFIMDCTFSRIFWVSHTRVVLVGTLARGVTRRSGPRDDGSRSEELF